MASNVDNLIREGIQAHRNGDIAEARNLLMKAVEIDDHSEQAWLWLSAVVDSSEEQQTCLENVLVINPNNEKAQQGLRILRDKSVDIPPPEPAKEQSNLLPEFPEADEDPFANVSFTPAPDESPAFATPTTSFDDETDADEDDELPDVSSWGVLETSSASALRPPDEPGPAEYNDWIDNLNIGSGNASEAFGTAADPATASPFFDDSDMADDESPFELDEDVFNFKQDTFSEPLEDLAETSTEVNPFGDFEIDDDMFEEPAPSAPAMTSPVLPTASAPANDLFLDDIAIDDDFDDDLLLDDDDDFDIVGADPEELFRLIPPEIKVTRMPGTKERYPAPLIIFLVLLLVLNIGAVGVTYMTLSSGLG